MSVYRAPWDLQITRHPCERGGDYFWWNKPMAAAWHAQQGICWAASALLSQCKGSLQRLFTCSLAGWSGGRQRNTGTGWMLGAVKLSLFKKKKIKGAGSLLLSTSLSVGRNNLARIGGISHLGVIWWLQGETDFGSSHILLSNSSCLGKSGVPEALAGEYLGCFKFTGFREITRLSGCLESY